MSKSRNRYRIARPHGAEPADAPTAIDLFAGAGGLSLGLSAAGFSLRAALEVNAACALTHARNFPASAFITDDIRRVSSAALMSIAGVRRGELDLLAGGPPCQGFSIIGQRVLDDPRNALFREFLRVAADLQPKVVVIENVPGLATLHGGAVLREIAQAFDEAGYDAECGELLAAQYGVPQMRWRMLFVGWRKDLGWRGGFPEPTHGRLGIGALVPNRTVTADDAEGFLTVADAIGDLPPIGAGETGASYVGKPQSAFQRAMREGLRRELFNHYAPRLAAQNLARIAALRPGQDWRDLPEHLLPPSMRRALRKDHTRRFRRMTWEGVSRSIITRFRDPKSGEYIHPEQDRTISIREAARIQSFPDWFAFEGTNTELYDQVGNAVPPLMARAIGEEIIAALRSAGRVVRPPRSRYSMPPTDLFEAHSLIRAA
jgi:DNA (cytosine-5)-methyltransferase 1